MIQLRDALRDGEGTGPNRICDGTSAEDGYGDPYGLGDGNGLCWEYPVEYNFIDWSKTGDGRGNGTPRHSDDNDGQHPGFLVSEEP